MLGTALGTGNTEVHKHLLSIYSACSVVYMLWAKRMLLSPFPIQACTRIHWNALWPFFFFNSLSRKSLYPDKILHVRISSKSLQVKNIKFDYIKILFDYIKIHERITFYWDINFFWVFPLMSEWFTKMHALHFLPLRFMWYIISSPYFFWKDTKGTSLSTPLSFNVRSICPIKSSASSLLFSMNN